MNQQFEDGDHAEANSLLGAYALHAVTPLEELRIERHMKVCVNCAREARLLGEAASELAFMLDGQELPDTLVDSIVESVPVAQSRVRPLVRTLAAVAAVALIAVGLLGATYVASRQKADSLAVVVAHAQRQVKLEATDKLAASGRVYVSETHVALVVDGLPPAGPSRTYQLWSLRKGVPTSLGVFKPTDGKVVRITSVKGPADAFAITVEPAGGSEVPTGTPILLGT